MFKYQEEWLSMCESAPASACPACPARPAATIADAAMLTTVVAAAGTNAAVRTAPGDNFIKYLSSD
jgi:hypothetical protein